MERDIKLDCCRALAMMYVVCIMHPILWFRLNVFGFDPTMLLDMPVFFFIAGASQQYTQRRTLVETIKNRSLRVLLPYYVSLCFILLFMLAATLLRLSFEGELLDIRQIGMAGIIKLLLTGGSQHIPYFGYTWFISTYMVISCSLPLQQWAMENIGGKWYLLLLLACFECWKSMGIASPENIVENVLSYNLFYVLGYVTYKKATTKWLIATAAVVVCLYLIISGIALPFGKHKFPSDMVYIAYSIVILYILAFFVSRIKIKYCSLIRLWNERGFTIYLYQCVSHFIVYKIIGTWLSSLHNDFLTFLIASVLVFAVATALSCITSVPEKYLVNKFIKR
ncbi:MAG: acyltransferase [Prevotella sp.]